MLRLRQLLARAASVRDMEGKAAGTGSENRAGKFELVLCQLQCCVQ